jgi:glycosyltransferase involved in cell wall biosynthesis
VRSPRATIGIPVFNGEKYLSTAIDSVLMQDYEDFELIISDNSSSDRTAEICRQYAAADRRVRYFRNDVNIGAVPNFNRVFSLARGEFFKWLSSDDVCHPEFLRRSVEILDQTTASVSLVYPQCEMIDEQGAFHGNLVEHVGTRAKQPYRRLREILVRRSTAQALCGLIRSDHLRLTRLRGSYVMDDMGLLAELAMVGEFIELESVLLKIRVHPGNANKINVNNRAHAIWLDPKNEQMNAVLGSQARLFQECFRSIYHLRMRRIDQLLCYLIVPIAYPERALRRIAGRLRKWASAIGVLRAAQRGMRS